MSDKTSGDGKKTFSEEIEVAGSQLVQRVKDLFAEGNVRRLRIKSADGDLILEIPLTVGAIAGGAMALAAPWLTLIAAFAGLVARARVEIVRDDPRQGGGASVDEGNDG
jgi:hypothetical protein